MLLAVSSFDIWMIRRESYLDVLGCCWGFVSTGSLLSCEDSKLKTQVIGHGARTNNVNTLEGRQGFEIAELIKTLVPKEAMLTKLSLVSCNSGDCMAGITNMVTDVKELFNKSLIVKGYQGTKFFVLP
jgi:hypothetical protein